MGVKGTQNQTRPGPFGGAPGQGRPPKSKQLKNYDAALKILDDNIEDALMVLVDGLKAMRDIYNTKTGQLIATVPDNYYRFNCAATLIKKVLPDKKSKELSGPGGTPLPAPVTVIDQRKLIQQIVVNLDDMSIDDIQKMKENGDLKLLRKDIDYMVEDEDKRLEEDARERISNDLGRATETEEERELEETETAD